MDEQVYRLPNLVLSFQLTIKSDRDEVEGGCRQDNEPGPNAPMPSGRL